jgi:hypothetical protein
MAIVVSFWFFADEKGRGLRIAGARTPGSYAR